jgi:hypothetical protein
VYSLASYRSCDPFLQLKVDAANASKNVRGVGEERVLILGSGSIEYTVQYVSSSGIYSATDELG